MLQTWRWKLRKWGEKAQNCFHSACSENYETSVLTNGTDSSMKSLAKAGYLLLIRGLRWALQWKKQSSPTHMWAGDLPRNSISHNFYVSISSCAQVPWKPNRQSSSGFSIIPFSCTSHYQNQSGPHWCPCKSPLNSLQCGSIAPAQRCKKNRRAVTLWCAARVRLQEDEGGKKPVPTFPQFAASLYWGWWVWGEGRTRASIPKSFYLNPSSPRPRDIQAPICTILLEENQETHTSSLPFGKDELLLWKQ